jgi:flavin reductase (DIM6/NTAB) family NADH-FMN oxidoreductase RutF
MRPLKLAKAFTLIEPGPVVLVTTRDGGRNNVMTISWTIVLDFTPRFAITTGAWNHSFRALQRTRECLANIECRVIDIVRKHDIVVLEGVAAHVATSRREQRTLHAVGDGTFVVDGRKLDRRKQMAAKIPSGV